MAGSADGQVGLRREYLNVINTHKFHMGLLRKCETLRGHLMGTYLVTSNNKELTSPKADHSSCWHLYIPKSFFLGFKKIISIYYIHFGSVSACEIPCNKSEDFFYLSLQVYKSSSNFYLLMSMKGTEIIFRQQLSRGTLKIPKGEYKVAFPASRGPKKPLFCGL